MRIIAGRFKGRRLSEFKASHIRPTTDRVKETIFNKLQAEVSGARVLDLFSGTGNLSLEALSRGAERVVAVEVNPMSLKIMKKNIEDFEVVNEIEVFRAEVIKFLGDYKGEAFDIVLADPPFTQMMSDDVMKAASLSEVCVKGGLFVIESQAKEVILDEYGDFKLLDRKNFGDKKVSFYRKNN